MSDEEFKAWFLKNLDSMVALGIMHYNADRAKDIRAVLNIVYPEIRELDERIKRIESQLNI